MCQAEEKGKVVGENTKESAGPGFFWTVRAGSTQGEKALVGVTWEIQLCS